MHDYAKLRRLTTRNERDVAATFERFGKLMAETMMRGRVVNLGPGCTSVDHLALATTLLP